MFGAMFVVKAAKELPSRKTAETRDVLKVLLHELLQGRKICLTMCQ